jgi:hypothetical protein
MKLSAFLVSFALAQEDGTVADDVCVSGGVEVSCLNVRGRKKNKQEEGRADLSPGERRYADLKEIAKKIWTKAGLKGKDKFDERKYWAYGCHCYLLGDRPLSEMGQGAPKDGLDNNCKAFKDCQKCVRDKHGEQCIGEFVQYTWKYAGNSGSFSSQNDLGSCEQELFQCDLKFAQDTFNSLDIFNTDFHAFWSTQPNGFDNRDPDNCPSNGGIPVEHQCCGGYDRPYHWIGLNHNQCCADGDSGRVVAADQSC